MNDRLNNGKNISALQLTTTTILSHIKALSLA